MAKTWFQHDMNASKKDGLSTLLEQSNGAMLYGQFWLLQEHFYTTQLHKETFKETIRINENTLLKVLKTNRRRLPTIIETFQECLGIGFKTFQERFGIVYETTVPNSLLFIRIRKQKSDNKSREDNTTIDNTITEKVENVLNILFGDFWDLYDKKVGKRSKLESKWNKLKDTDRELIMEYIPKYKKNQPDKQFRKNPEVFLNNESWNDELVERSNGRYHKQTGVID